MSHFFESNFKETVSKTSTTKKSAKSSSDNPTSNIQKALQLKVFDLEDILDDTNSSKKQSVLNKKIETFLRDLKNNKNILKGDVPNFLNEFLKRIKNDKVNKYSKGVTKKLEEIFTILGISDDENNIEDAKNVESDEENVADTENENKEKNIIYNKNVEKKIENPTPEINKLIKSFTTKSDNFDNEILKIVENSNIENINLRLLLNCIPLFNNLDKFIEILRNKNLEECLLEAIYFKGDTADTENENFKILYHISEIKCNNNIDESKYFIAKKFYIENFTKKNKIYNSENLKNDLLNQKELTSLEDMFLESETFISNLKHSYKINYIMNLISYSFDLQDYLFCLFLCHNVLVLINEKDSNMKFNDIDLELLKKNLLLKIDIICVINSNITQSFEFCSFNNEINSFMKFESENKSFLMIYLEKFANKYKKLENNKLLLKSRNVEMELFRAFYYRRIGLTKKVESIINEIKDFGVDIKLNEVEFFN